MGAVTVVVPIDSPINTVQRSSQIPLLICRIQLLRACLYGSVDTLTHEFDFKGPKWLILLLRKKHPHMILILQLLLLLVA